LALFLFHSSRFRSIVLNYICLCFRPSFNFWFQLLLSVPWLLLSWCRWLQPLDNLLYMLAALFDVLYHRSGLRLFDLLPSLIISFNLIFLPRCVNFSFLFRILVDWIEPVIEFHQNFIRMHQLYFHYLQHFFPSFFLHTQVNRASDYLILMHRTASKGK